MSSPLRIVGYAIVSADGMIADGSGRIPPTLIHEADQRYFLQGVDEVDVLVHGRNSHEELPHASRRRRLVVTRQVAALAPHPDNPKAMLWNPGGATIEDACNALGISQGIAAAIGGSEVYGLFLPLYEAFHLSRAATAQIPGGRPVFPGIPPATPEEMLARYGLRPAQSTSLDADADLSVVTWTR
jgi:dihydrofolate reductase